MHVQCRVELTNQPLESGASHRCTNKVLSLLEVWSKSNMCAVHSKPAWNCRRHEVKGGNQ